MKNKKVDVKTKVGYAIIAAILVLLVLILFCLKSIYYSIDDINPILGNERSTLIDEESIMNAVNKTNNMKDLSEVLKIEEVSIWAINGEKDKKIELPVQGNIFENGYKPEIRGKIINKTKNMYTNIEIKYNLYDNNNNIIGILSDYTNVKGGETINIDAIDKSSVGLDYNKIHHYKLASVKGVENK